MSASLEGPEGKGRPRRPGPGGSPGDRRARAPLLSGRRGWMVVYLMLVYGSALIVGTLALWYVTAPTSTTPPSAVPCGIGALPPVPTGPNASLAARSTSYPPPINGSLTPEAFTLWINTTARLLPGLNVTFAVRDLPGSPEGSACTLPIPPANWVSNVSSLTVDPQQNYQVGFLGVPTPGYDRVGAFALETWVNATNAPGSLGGTHVFCTVAPSS